MSGAPRKPLPVLSSDAADAASVRSAALRAGRGTKVALITLGCDKNTVDSERILSGLVGAGVEVVDSPDGADVVVVNTCGFIELAKQESVDTLLAAARLKEAGRVRAVVGLGCLVQRYKPELVREMPEVDLFLGLTEVDRLVPELARRGLADDTASPLMERPLRILSAGSGPGHTAHLKISEGCDHTCAFCAIPLMRGKFRSTPLDLLVREARELEARGVVELNIVSQDTTWYGRDLARGPVEDTGSYFVGRPFESPLRRVAGSPVPVPRTGALPMLLRSLLDQTSLPWLRLFYMYPSGITRELVALIAAESRILPYLDMPIQHGSDAVLARMRRPERRSTILERVGWLRDAVPELALRTTVIVGFPGETEDDFDALVALLEEVRFDHVGGFAYSEEEDTPAASLPGAVPTAVRRERLERLLDVQRGISLERNEARIGTRVRVLVDAMAGDRAVARAPWQAPEVDGVVVVEAAPDLLPGPGRFADVLITGADEYDLTGRLA